MKLLAVIAYTYTLVAAIMLIAYVASTGLHYVLGVEETLATTLGAFLAVSVAMVEAVVRMWRAS